MTKADADLYTWFLEHIEFIDVMCAGLAEDFIEKSMEYKEASERYSKINRPDDALASLAWHHAMTHSHQQTQELRRHITELIEQINARLPIRPQLTLAVDNTKTPAATGVDHIHDKNASNEYDRNK